MQRPAIAALLSLLVPGLGQIYNQSRKGLLFFAVGMMNLVLVCAIFLTRPLIEGLQEIARSMHFRVNDSIIAVLNQVHVSLPSTFLIVGFAVAFVCFVAYDAYNGANLRKSSAAEAGVVISISEAVGASYVIHLAVGMALCLFFSFFFPPAQQKPDEPTVCEFVLQSTEEKNKEETKLLSLKTAATHGRFDPTKEISKTHSSPASSESSPDQQQQATTQQSANQAAPEAKHQQAQKAMQARQAVKPVPSTRQKEPPKPVTKSASTKQMALPEKHLQPRKSVDPARAAEQRQAIQQRQAARQRQATAAKQLHQARELARRSAENTGRAFNLDRNVDDRSGSVAANADLNFGPYMNQLQRRMKRNWSPPAGSISRAVTVLFKIHADGSITNVRLLRSSGSGACDRAAINAVQATSPFMPLPPGASAPVSIEFTFDYGMSTR